MRQAGGQIGREDPTDVERVYPGGLAVSRAIGDLPAKHPIPAVRSAPRPSAAAQRLGVLLSIDFDATPALCFRFWDVLSQRHPRRQQLPHHP